jgi:hypothetical protein
MNKDWARQKLTGYLNSVRRYESFLHGPDGAFNQEAYEQVMFLEPAAKAIMERVNPRFSDYEFVQSASSKALTQAIHTIALLDQAEEIEANLTPAGPQLSADQLHQWVWDAARNLWETKHYREAVQAAATSINAHLQDLAHRRDVSDYKLTTELFSENSPEPGKPRLRWPGDPTDEAYKSMQTGLRSYGASLFQCIRNHATHDLNELSEQEALERLAAMSLFCRWVETCRLVGAQ